MVLASFVGCVNGCVNGCPDFSNVNDGIVLIGGRDHQCSCNHAYTKRCVQHLWSKLPRMHAAAHVWVVRGRRGVRQRDIGGRAARQLLGVAVGVARVSSGGADGGDAGHNGGTGCAELLIVRGLWVMHGDGELWVVQRCWRIVHAGDDEWSIVGQLQRVEVVFESVCGGALHWRSDAGRLSGCSRMWFLCGYGWIDMFARDNVWLIWRSMLI